VGELDPRSAVGMGYAYRLLRDEVNTGRLVEAHPRARDLAAGIRARFGDTALEPAATIAAYRNAATLEDVGRIGPYFLPGFFQHAATLAQHVERDYARARAWYRAAGELAIECARIGPVLFLEAPTLVWPARIADAVLGLALGDDNAAEILLALMQDGLDATPVSGYGCVARDRIETLLPPVIEELGTRRRHTSARRLAEGYRDYVARHYGAALLSTDGVLAALRDERPAPVDPWFAPYAKDTLARDGPVTEATRVALADFATRVDGAAELATERARDLAARARRLAGVAPPPAGFSFEMSFDLKPGR
jgi:hypothetical protein